MPKLLTRREHEQRAGKLSSLDRRGVAYEAVEHSFVWNMDELALPNLPHPETIAVPTNA